MRKFLKEFKGFVQESDFVTVAIGFLVATAVKDLTGSFFTNLVEPLLNGLLHLCGVDTAGGVVTIFGMQFGFAAFLAQIIAFIFMLLIAFFFMKGYNKLVKGNKTADVEEENEVSEEVKLLQEIRDELKRR